MNDFADNLKRFYRRRGQAVADQVSAELVVNGGYDANTAHLGALAAAAGYATAVQDLMDALVLDPIDLHTYIERAS